MRGGTQSNDLLHLCRREHEGTHGPRARVLAPRQSEPAPTSATCYVLGVTGATRQVESRKHDLPVAGGFCTLIFGMLIYSGGRTSLSFLVGGELRRIRRIILHAHGRVVLHREPRKKQVLTSNPLVESWGHFPRSRKRLLDLLHRTNPAGLVVLSGDVHHAELASGWRATPPPDVGVDVDVGADVGAGAGGALVGGAVTICRCFLFFSSLLKPVQLPSPVLSYFGRVVLRFT